MKFADGSDIKTDELIQIAGVYRGRVVASMNTSDLLLR